jgi:hypothetical protein
MRVGTRLGPYDILAPLGAGPVAHPDKPATVMHVVLNWGDELKRLVPAR